MVSEERHRIAIAGTGAVARAFGRLLIEAGDPAAYILSRDTGRGRAAADAIGAGIRAASYEAVPKQLSRLIIAVPDSAIAPVASAFTNHPGLQVALHTSGNSGLDALDSLAQAGISCGIIHPLQTVTHRSPNALKGAAFSTWGTGLAARWSEQIVQAARGTLLRIAPEHRSAYHAAAVMASNHVLALLDSSEWLLERAGVPRTAARHALSLLLRTTVEGGLKDGPVSALTGPVSRGDAATVRSHLNALLDAPPDIRNLYRSASERTLDLARRKGLDEDQAAQVEAALKGNTHGTECT